jgi:hypothetical protein
LRRVINNSKELRAFKEFGEFSKFPKFSKFLKFPLMKNASKH